MSWTNSQIARCLNAHYGRWENFWNSKTYSRQRLGDADAVLDEIVYTITRSASRTVPISSGTRSWSRNAWVLSCGSGRPNGASAGC